MRIRPSFALSLALSLVAPLWARPILLQDGTPVKLRLARNISSADAREGETVDFEVLEEIAIDGTTVIKRGAVALATITQAQARGRMGKGGKLDMNIDHARLANGEKVALRAVKEMKGAGSGGKMTGAMVATSLILWPAAPFFLFMKGKDVTIPKGTEITAYVNGETRLESANFGQPGGTMNVNAGPPTVAAPAPAAAPASSVRALTNEDVLKMVRAKFSESLIMAKIKNSPSAYSTDPDELVKLKGAGVSEAVITAMLERAGQ